MYYTGICTNLERRVTEHNHDDQKGARYTKPRRPVEVVFSVSDIVNRSLASKGERFMKKLPRAKKQLLIKGDEVTMEALLKVVNRT